MVLDEHLLPIPSRGQCATCYTFPWKFPKFPLKKQFMCCRSSPLPQENQAETSRRLQWVDEQPSRQKPLRPLGTPQACGKSLGLMWCKGEGAPHPLEQVGQVLERWEVTPSTQGHLPICRPPGCPQSAHSNPQDTICSVQSEGSVDGRGLFCSVDGLIYGLFTWMPHPRCQYCN